MIVLLNGTYYNNKRGTRNHYLLIFTHLYYCYNCYYEIVRLLYINYIYFKAYTLILIIIRYITLL